jgi:hypothetical protein
MLLLWYDQVKRVDLLGFCHHDGRGAEAGVRRGDL